MQDPATLMDLEEVFANILRLAISGVGIASLVMLVWGGMQFLTAGSDKEGSTRARQTLTYAIGGLILTLSAWIILNLLGNFLGVDFDTFSLSLPFF